MKTNMKCRSLVRLFVMTSLAVAAFTDATATNLPYDETANAEAALRSGLTQAQNQHKKVLVIFGANWCPDCRALDQALRGQSKTLIDSKFVVVKVDVGHFDKNLALSERYENPIGKGIPAAVVLTADQKIVYSTKAGELSNARRMSETGIYDFFAKVAESYR